ncbi:hypothetical protein BB558_003236 [Smittium angustum]|uniref:Uncharacterized protein n=1 Tax=Smittium angustum TaxID=133377 RepID=A0A2U1J6M8_SMIAN|nr:hypothetical protein BB558_003236 [Smittium angustum]
MSRPFHPRIPSENLAPTPEIPAEENPLQPDNNGPDLLIPVLDPGKNAPRFQHPSPEVSLKLPNASKFDGNPNNYQEFISLMSFYFWARDEFIKATKTESFLSHRIFQEPLPSDLIFCFSPTPHLYPISKNSKKNLRENLVIPVSRTRLAGLLENVGKHPEVCPIMLQNLGD